MFGKTFTSSPANSTHQKKYKYERLLCLAYENYLCLKIVLFTSLLINTFIFIMKIPSPIYQFHPSFQIQYIFLFKLFLPFPISIPIQHTRAIYKKKRKKIYKNKKGSFKWSNVVYYNYPTGSTTPIYVEWKYEQKKKKKEKLNAFSRYILFYIQKLFSKMLIFVLFSVGNQILLNEV